MATTVATIALILLGASLYNFSRWGNSQNGEISSLHSAIQTLQAAKIPPKSDYNGWRDTLHIVTRQCLQEMAREGVDVAELNDVGVFHKFDGKAGNVYRDFAEENSMPSEWIHRGHFPGIWCPLKDPGNTCSGPTSGLTIGQFKFRRKIKIYDPEHKPHQQMWEEWKNRPENSEKYNSWDSAKNDEGSTMSSRMFKFMADATHFDFYRENKFGAVVGYSDNMALVIVDEELVLDLLECKTT